MFQRVHRVFLPTETIHYLSWQVQGPMLIYRQAKRPGPRETCRHLRDSHIPLEPGRCPCSQMQICFQLDPDKYMGLIFQLQESGLAFSLDGMR